MRLYNSKQIFFHNQNVSFKVLKIDYYKMICMYVA